MTDLPPSRKRRRPILACEACRRKKVKCDRNIPCGPCTRSRAEYCNYSEVDDELARDKQQKTPRRPSESVPPLPFTAPQWFGSATLTLPHSPTNMSIVVDTGKEGKSAERHEPATARGTFVDNRFYGPSHWINSFQQPLVNFDQLPNSGGVDRTLYQDYQALVTSSNALHRGRAIPERFVETIPQREVGVQLVQAYLRTFEMVLRVLHVPSFLRECQQYWAAPDDAREEFLLKLGLVMAIGASFCPQVPVSNHATAVWIDTAQNWLGELICEASASSGSGSSSGLELVQIFCLLLEARQARNKSVNVDADGKQWCILSAETLVRTAKQIGLHMDPAKLPNLPFFEQEMRRRLWATVQEMALQGAMDDGHQPVLKTNDNGSPPWNLADEQFNQQTPAMLAPLPQPPDQFTHTSIQITLHKSLPLRLAIANAVNDVSNDDEVSYAYALQLSSELSAESRAILTHLHRIQARGFGARLCELLLHRFLLALHAPFALLARTDPTLYYSRKVVTEVSLSILCRCSQVSSDDYARLLCVGSEPFVHVPIQAASMLCHEAMSQVEEDLFPASFAQAAHPATRTTLQKVVQAYVHVLSLRVKAGSSEVRPYVLLSGQLAKMDAVQDGLPTNNRSAMTRAMQLCQQILPAPKSGEPAGEEAGEAAHTANSGGGGDGDGGGRGDACPFVNLDLSTEGPHDDVTDWLLEDDSWTTGFS